MKNLSTGLAVIAVGLMINSIFAWVVDYRQAAAFMLQLALVFAVLSLRRNE